MGAGGDRGWKKELVWFKMLVHCTQTHNVQNTCVN